MTRLQPRVVDVVAALEDAGREPEEVEPGAWRAYCPAHESRFPELDVLSVAYLDPFALRCHGGCRSSDVLRELGLEAR